MRFLIIDGPNLNLLGAREPEQYGTLDYNAMYRRLEAFAKANASTAVFFQSNAEGALIDAIHTAPSRSDAIILNPGAYTHTSHAIGDALRAINVPAMEVHLTNIHARESFRAVSLTASACVGMICGLGVFGYEAAMLAFLEKDIR